MNQSKKGFARKYRLISLKLTDCDPMKTPEGCTKPMMMVIMNNDAKIDDKLGDDLHFQESNNKMIHLRGVNVM